MQVHFFDGCAKAILFLSLDYASLSYLSRDHTIKSSQIIVHKYGCIEINV